MQLTLVFFPGIDLLNDSVTGINGKPTNYPTVMHMLASESGFELNTNMNGAKEITCYKSEPLIYGIEVNGGTLIENIIAPEGYFINIKTHPDHRPH